jgi:hypothetical protein
MAEAAAEKKPLLVSYTEESFSQESTYGAGKLVMPTWFFGFEFPYASGALYINSSRDIAHAHLTVNGVSPVQCKTPPENAHLAGIDADAEAVYRMLNDSSKPGPKENFEASLKKHGLHLFLTFMHGGYTAITLPHVLGAYMPLDPKNEPPEKIYAMFYDTPLVALPTLDFILTQHMVARGNHDRLAAKDLVEKAKTLPELANAEYEKLTKWLKSK